MSLLGRLRDRYIKLYGLEATNPDEISKIEKALGVQIPEDMKSVSEFYSGGHLGSVSHYSISSFQQADNIVEKTLKLRKQVGLDDCYIVLAELDESIIFLKTGNDSQVIWCDSVEVSHLGTGKFFNEPNFWKSYQDFFEYLLNEEEQSGHA